MWWCSGQSKSKRVLMYGRAIVSHSHMEGTLLIRVIRNFLKIAQLSELQTLGFQWDRSVHRSFPWVLGRSLLGFCTVGATGLGA